MDEAHKADVLRHCLFMAETDPTYATWAAGWYEKNEPVLLKNLQAKVKQEIRRSKDPTTPFAGPGA